MKLLLSFLAVLTGAAPAVHGTIEYRPRMQKIEITAENTLITVSYSSASPQVIHVTAKHGDVTYEVPEKEARILSGRSYLDAEVKILPYEAGADPRKVEGFVISFVTLHLKKRQDVVFLFGRDSVFEKTVILDVDETGVRPAK
jgi:hypothetical protein